MASENIREGTDVRRMVANALFDPGKFVAREITPVERGFPELEPLHAWQLRAIEAVLAPLDDLPSRLWREEAWKCYVASGADPDGADARHLNPGEAAAAVKELAEQYGEAIKAVPLAADHTTREPPPTRATLARALLAIYDASNHDSDAALFNAVRKTEVESLSREALTPLTDGDQ